MQENKQTLHNYNDYQGKGNSVPYMLLCITLFLVLAVTPKLPSGVTQLLRPMVIGACFVIPAKYMFRMTRTIQVFGIYLFYMTLVFLFHPLTRSSFMAWMSAILFGAFFVVVSQRIWNTKEVRVIVFTVFIGSLCYALLLQHFNHDLLHSSGERVFDGIKVNTNAAAYTICPGAICGVFIILYYHSKSKFYLLSKICVAAGTAFCYYTLICLASRAAFFSGVIGAVLALWEKCGASGRNKTTLRALLIIIIGIVLVLGPRISEGTNAERVFNYEKLMDDNGRDELNDRAKEMIREKPVFGGGYDYWNNESGETLGLHNGLLLIMVTGGAVAGILIILFFIFLSFDIIRTRSLIAISFVILAMFHMFVDSGLDYFSYIPLILAYVLSRHALFRQGKVEDIMKVG